MFKILSEFFVTTLKAIRDKTSKSRDRVYKLLAENSWLVTVILVLLRTAVRCGNAFFALTRALQILNIQHFLAKFVAVPLFTASITLVTYNSRFHATQREIEGLAGKKHEDSIDYKSLSTVAKLIYVIVSISNYISMVFIGQASVLAIGKLGSAAGQIIESVVDKAFDGKYKINTEGSREIDLNCDVNNLQLNDLEGPIRYYLRHASIVLGAAIAFPNAWVFIFFQGAQALEAYNIFAYAYANNMLLSIAFVITILFGVPSTFAYAFSSYFATYHGTRDILKFLLELMHRVINLKEYAKYCNFILIIAMVSAINAFINNFLAKSVSFFKQTGIKKKVRVYPDDKIPEEMNGNNPVIETTGLRIIYERFIISTVYSSWGAKIYYPLLFALYVAAQIQANVGSILDTLQVIAGAPILEIGGPWVQASIITLTLFLAFCSATLFVFQNYVAFSSQESQRYFTKVESPHGEQNNNPENGYKALLEDDAEHSAGEETSNALEMADDDEIIREDVDGSTYDVPVDNQSYCDWLLSKCLLFRSSSNGGVAMKTYENNIEEIAEKDHSDDNSKISLLTHS